MSNVPAVEVAQKMAECLLECGPLRASLLLQIMRTLAHGNPVSSEQVSQIVSEVGIAQEDAYPFLNQISEWDIGHNLVGILGLSLNHHPYRMRIGGTSFSAWCAEDTLWLPSLLDTTITVESHSPVSRERIELTVSPTGIERIIPAGAYITIRTADPAPDDVASVQQIWGSCCSQSHFFASREEAERWVAGRDTIAVLTVDEGLERCRQMWTAD